MFERIRKKLRTAVAVVLAGVIALSMAPTGGTALADGIDGIAANVTLYNYIDNGGGNHTQGDEITEGTLNIEKDQKVRVRFDVTVDNGKNAAGESVSFTFPKEIPITADNLTGDVTATDGTVIGSWKVDPTDSTGTATGTITFNENATNYDNISAYLYVDTQFAVGDDENTTPVTVNFGFNGTTQPLNLHFTQDSPNLNKPNATFNAGDSTAEWTIEVNGGKKDDANSGTSNPAGANTTIVSGTLTDALPEGLTYQDGTFKVHDVTADKDITVSSGDLQVSEDKRNLTYTLPENTSDSYTVTFTTKVDPSVYGTNPVTNSAELQDGSTKVDATGTVTPNPNYISKSGKFVKIDGVAYLQWSIPFNNDNPPASLEGVQITDQFLNKDQVDAGWKLVDGSVKLGGAFSDSTAIASGGTAVSSDSSATPYYEVTNNEDGSKKLVYHGGDVSTQETLNFTVQLPDNYLQQNQQGDNATVNNTAYLSATNAGNPYLNGGTPSGSASVGIGNAVVEKSGSADGSDGSVTWTVTVNSAAQTLASPEVTDHIGYNYNNDGTESLKDKSQNTQTFQPDTFKVYEGTAATGTLVYESGGSSNALGSATLTSSDQGFTFDFNQSIDKVYTIVYQTQLNTTEQASVLAGNDSATYYDDVKLQPDKNTTTIPSSTANANTTLTGQVLAKNSAGYDYANHESDWTVKVNQNNYSLSDVFVTDDLSDDSLKFPDSLTKYKGQYAFVFDTVTAADTSGQSIALNDAGSVDAVKNTANTYYYDSSAAAPKLYVNLGNIRKQVNLSVKLKFNAVDAGAYDAYFTAFNTDPNTGAGKQTLKNNVSVTSTAYGTPVTAGASQDIRNTVVGKTATYNGQPYVDWQVPINENSVNLGEVTLSDSLQTGLYLDTSTVALYPMKVNADGTYSADTTQPITLTKNNIVYDGQTNLFTFHMPGTDALDAVSSDTNPVKAAYVLTFRTYLDPSLNGGSVSNEITLTGSQTTQTGDKGSFQVTWQMGGGGGSGNYGTLGIVKEDGSTHAPLSGATFALYDQYGYFLRDASKDADGNLYFTYLKSGISYTIKELTPPDGYNNDNEGKSFTFTYDTTNNTVKVQTDADAAVTVTQTGYASIYPSAAFTDTLKTGTIQFTKLGLAVDGTELSGAQFTLNGKALNGSSVPPILSNITGADGVVKFNDVPYSNKDGYTITESTTPDGYAPIAPMTGIVLNGNTAPTGTLTPPDQTDDAIGNLTVTKTDADRDPDSVKLPGAVFKLSNGTLTYPSTYNQDDGTYTFTGIRAGDYTLHEETPPKGYAPAADKNVSITGDVTARLNTSATVADTRDVGTLQFSKTETGSNRLLAGAVFGVYYDKGGQKPVKINNNEVKATSDDYGDVVFNNFPLADADNPDGFWVVEDTPPADHVKSVAPFQVKLDENTRKLKLDPKTDDRKIGTIQFTKKAPDGSTLAGATFKLTGTGSFSDYTQTVDSDADGLVKFTDVPYGEYKLTETKAPADYTLVAPEDVLLSDSNTHNTGVLVMRDIVDARKTGTVQFTKKAPDSSGLAGATFTLKGTGSYSDYKQTAVSDANGLVKFTNVPYGDYLLTESGAPANYTAIAPVNVSLHADTADGTGTLTMSNMVDALKTGTVRFIKQNEFFDPLPGAQFTLRSAGGWSATATAGTDGTVTFVNVPYGALTLSESKAPDGYYTMAPIAIDFTVSNTALKNGVLDLDTYVDIPGTGVLDEFTMRKRALEMAAQRAAAEAAEKAQHTNNPQTGGSGPSWPAAGGFALLAGAAALPPLLGRRRRRRR